MILRFALIMNYPGQLQNPLFMIYLHGLITLTKSVVLPLNNWKYRTENSFLQMSHHLSIIGEVSDSLFNT